MSKPQITSVNVHPLVLLSIVDHFNRVNLKQRSKRVVGALLGTHSVYIHRRNEWEHSRNCE